MGQIKRNLSVLGFSFSILGFTFALFAKFVIGSNNFFREFGVFPSQIVLIAFLCFVGTLLLLHTTRIEFFKSILDSSFLQKAQSIGKHWSVRKKGFALSVFTTISFISFKLNENLLLVGIDGQTMLTNLKSSESFSESFFYFSNNPLQGLGTTPFYQVNFAVDPGYILLRINPLQLGIPLAYTLWSLLLLTSCMVLCYSLKLEFQLAFVASSLAVFFLVYPHGFFFNVVTFLVPQVITTMSITTLIISLLLLDWKNLRPWQIYGRRIALALLLLLYSLHNPNYLILLLPLLASFVIELVFRFKEVRRPTLKAFDMISLLSSVFGIILAFSFSASLILYSAAFFHGDELQNTYKMSLNTLSVVFSRRYAVGVMVTLAIFLILVDFLKTRSSRSHTYFRTIRVVLVFVLIHLLLSSLALVFEKSWRGPLPFYFEFPIFPLYAIMVALLLIRGAKSVLASLSALFSPSNHFFRKFDYRLAAVLLPLLYLLSLNVQSLSNYKSDSKVLNSGFSKFVQENRMNVDSPFAGRFESFLLQENDRQLTFRNYSEEVVRNIQKKFGSSFRFGDVWKFTVPTLVEYHANFSPRSYEVTKLLLSSQNYSFARTGSFFTNLNIDHAELLGVSKVVTNSRLEEIMPTLIMSSSDSRIYFSTLKSPNLGQVSPLDFVVVKRLHEMKHKIQEAGDLRNIVFVEEQLADRPAKPASNSFLKVVRGGYHIVGHSLGKSMILLPVEYSSCYTFHPQPHDKTLDIVDANIGMTLVVFDKIADFEIKYRHGPLTNPLCKFRDLERYRDFENSQKTKL